jgi:protein TonB
VGGRVVLDCRVQPSLAVNCSVASETPAGEGFGRAALGVANAYRARGTLSDGTSSIGASTRIAVNFQAPQ